MSDPQTLSEKVSAALPALIAESKIARGELTITVEPQHLLSVLGWLQWQGEFKILVDICGVDWPQRAKRFDVVYHLLSLTNNQRIRVKAMVGRGREFTDEEMDMVMASPAAAQILHMISYTGAGTPDTVVDYLHRFAEHADADELMISPTATRQPDVLTAMELLADNWN